MLFKHRTPVAREARFVVPVELAQAACEPDPAPELPQEQQEISPDRLEVARLQAEIEAANLRLLELHTGWDEAVQDAEARALAAAAQNHVANDAARLELLDAALSKAAIQFDEALSAKVLPLARTMAIEALGRLVVPQANEREWLVRTITRRLDEVRAESVTKLSIAGADVPEADLLALAAAMPTGSEVTADSALKSGTARIDLRLGKITINPADGLRHILTVISQDD